MLSRTSCSFKSFLSKCLLIELPSSVAFSGKAYVAPEVDPNFTKIPFLTSSEIAALTQALVSLPFSSSTTSAVLKVFFSFAILSIASFISIVVKLYYQLYSKLSSWAFQGVKKLKQLHHKKDGNRQPDRNPPIRNIKAF